MSPGDGVSGPFSESSDNGPLTPSHCLISICMLLCVEFNKAEGVCRAKWSVQVKREAGASPARSRHRDSIAFLITTGGVREGKKALPYGKIDQSGDLPVAVHG